VLVGDLCGSLWWSKFVGLVSDVGGWMVANQGFEAGRVMAGGNWEWGYKKDCADW